MKFVFSSIFSLLMIFILVRCNSQKKNSQKTNGPFFQREWMLISFQDFSKEKLMENSANINLSNKSGENFSANMGCNNLFFTAEIKNNGKINISDIGSTMKYCEGKMDLEQKFISIFPTMKNYKIEGHFLTLSNGKGISMRFVAADWD